MDTEENTLITRQTLLQLFKDYGFHKASIVNTDQFLERLKLDLPRFGKGSFVLCALSCYRKEPDDLSRPGDPHGLIAPFARRNYYREAVKRLKKIVGEIGEETQLSKQDVRIFCNSRLPEKPLAAACGLGFYGKNALIISPGLGSMFVIAGIFLPLFLEPDSPRKEWLEAGRSCGSCSACIDACPVGAIPRPGVVDIHRCLQALAAKAGSFTPGFGEAWSVRLYGCQTCQEVCPFNRNLNLETSTDLGCLGPSMSLREILTRSTGDVKDLFRGTQLGMSWVDGAALMRNAILAAGNRRDSSLIPELEACVHSDDSLLKDSALWALRRIKGFYGRVEA